ncbi:hypothetical protein DM47_3105 [Burkholderia mallei]|nr:hypothetical protein DM77_3188 [Burkholderia mallei]KOT19855.1 hypothetical protein DM47_3105 [Burkholderia mallei]
MVGGGVAGLADHLSFAGCVSSGFRLHVDCFCRA